MPIAIDITKQISSRLLNDNIQVFSLRSLPADLLEPYETGRQLAVLIHANTLHRGQVSILNDRLFSVAAPSLEAAVTLDAHVLVTLPSTNAKRYVIQARVTKQVQGFCILQVLDPRLHHRCQAADHHGLQFRPVPYQTVDRLADGEIRVVRTKAGLGSKRLVNALHRHPEASPADSATAAVSIIDTLFEREREEAAAEQIDLEKKCIFSATLTNISQGGLCLHFSPKTDRSMLNRLLYVDLRCPPAPAGADPMPPAIMEVHAFATVRRHNRRVDGEHDSLHLMFLHHLPEAVDTCCFTAMEELLS